MIGVPISIRFTPSGSTPCHPGGHKAKAPPRAPTVSHDRLASKSCRMSLTGIQYCRSPIGGITRIIGSLRRSRKARR